ncbi:tRNA wybutosine-synthesizing protein 3 homolog [Xyrichtys novacula]|uniref:tRNA wybutosine-synthesizing protein 3 homolog n=1 Tax=Xyrichtys novacula TaxID=13765 RepID=A0AAV1HQ61_XYRNO|nr:tRNA wybutosine-synthesizing protein 3 homolog [Xyrichtys novacula]
MEKTFSLWKQQCLGKVDLSRKSCVDEDIEHVVFLLNSCEEYFTTSSCSGRLTLIDGVTDSCGVQKQNCVWLFVSHQKCKPEDLMCGLARSRADAVLKFEPFVLHVQCRQLKDAQLLHSVAVNSGFRNSGLTVSKTGKILMAVRSTHGMEVPLTNNGILMVDHEYIHFLTKIANQKMEENLRRIQRFHQNFQSAMSRGQVQKQQIPNTDISEELQNPSLRLMEETQEEKSKDRKNKRTVYKQKKSGDELQQTDACCADGSCGELDLEDCLDLFS